jgi:hypothetical protein
MNTKIKAKTTKKQPNKFLDLFNAVKDNIKIISVFSFVFMIVGFCLGVYTDVMSIKDIKGNVTTLNNKVDKLVEIIVTNSATKFENKSESKAPLEKLNIER